MQIYATNLPDKFINFALIILTKFGDLTNTSSCWLLAKYLKDADLPKIVQKLVGLRVLKANKQKLMQLYNRFLGYIDVYHQFHFMFSINVIIHFNQEQINVLAHKK